jgi:hypothetical protein
LEPIEGGGVTSAPGFKAAGIHAGFRKQPERLDMAIVEADELCVAAGVVTQNVFCAAPVILCREHLGPGSAGTARAVVINSGVANAATGPRGLDDARQMAALAAEEIAVYVANKKQQSTYADVLVRLKNGNVEIDFRSLGEVFDPMADEEGDIIENVKMLRSIASSIQNEYVLGMNSVKITIDGQK